MEARTCVVPTIKHVGVKKKCFADHRYVTGRGTGGGEAGGVTVKLAGKRKTLGIIVPWKVNKG